MLKNSRAMENLALSKTHLFQTPVSMDHWWKCFLVEFNVDSNPTQPVLDFFKYPIPNQNLIFHTRSTPRNMFTFIGIILKQPLYQLVNSNVEALQLIIDNSLGIPRLQ